MGDTVWLHWGLQQRAALPARAPSCAVLQPLLRETPWQCGAARQQGRGTAVDRSSGTAQAPAPPHGTEAML